MTVLEQLHKTTILFVMWIQNQSKGAFSFGHLTHGSWTKTDKSHFNVLLFLAIKLDWRYIKFYTGWYGDHHCFSYSISGERGDTVTRNFSHLLHHLPFSTEMPGGKSRLSLSIRNQLCTNVFVYTSVHCQNLSETQIWQINLVNIINH